MGKLVGPLMLALLIGIAIFMLIAMQSPELAAQFRRPEGFYNNMLGKTAVAILFAAVVSLVVWIVRGRIK